MNWRKGRLCLRDKLGSGAVMLMDGAMGTELQRAGIKEGECYELWNLTQPERVRAIHQAYVDAGARCLLTNTFQSNPVALARRGVQDRLEEINKAAVQLAASVAGPEGIVLGDIGPIGDGAGHWNCGTAEVVGRVMRSLASADGFIFETLSDIPAVDLPALCRQLFAPDDKPVFLSFTFRRNAGSEICTTAGQTPEQCAAVAVAQGVFALGVNCGRDIGMDEAIGIVRRYRRAAKLPLFARPNAGTPVRREGSWHYPQTSEYMAARLPDLLNAGVHLVGGCCGTTPAHIAAFRPIVEQWNAPRGCS